MISIMWHAIYKRILTTLGTLNLLVRSVGNFLLQTESDIRNNSVITKFDIVLTENSDSTALK